MITGQGGAVDLGGGDTGNTDGTGESQGSDAGATNSTGDNQGGAQGDLFAGLSPENQQFAASKGFSAEDLNKVFDSHRNADKLISQGAHKNQQGNSDGQAGDGSTVPANPAGYEFRMPDGMPDGLPYDKGFAEKFANFAHNKKVPAGLARDIHDFYVGAVSEQFSSAQQQSSEQLNTAVTTTFDTLTKEWGQPETPGFQRNLELSKRAMTHLGPGFKQALVDAGVIRVNGKDEIVTNPDIMLGLQRVGATMFAEDSEFGGNPSRQNPFDPRTQNLAAQGDLIRENRELAKQLIRAAGQEEHWGHVLNK